MFFIITGKGHITKSPLELKELDVPDSFCIIVVPCTLASKKKHNLTHFCSVLQNSKLSQWWPPNQGEHLDRLIYEIQCMDDKMSFDAFLPIKNHALRGGSLKYQDVTPSLNVRSLWHLLTKSV